MFAIDHGRVTKLFVYDDNSMVSYALYGQLPVVERRIDQTEWKEDGDGEQKLYMIKGG